MTIQLLKWTPKAHGKIYIFSRSLHIFHQQVPFMVQDPSELWNVDNGQLSQLFDDMVKLSLDNCLVDNRWGAVACAEAKRDPSLAVRPPVSSSKDQGTFICCRWKIPQTLYLSNDQLNQ